MKFHSLHENLRKLILHRIQTGELTQLKLAAQTGFQQAHISNFLNKKRFVSMDGLDRVLTAGHLSILDLLDPADVNRRASILPPSEDEFENVLVVEGEVAANDRVITKEQVKGILKFKKSFLRRLRCETVSSRDGWRRFVVSRISSRNGLSMYPRLLPGSSVLIDRHYNSLAPYRKGEANMYAVRVPGEGGCTIHYVELAGKNLVLRPHNRAYPITVLPIAEGKSVADSIIGRICHVGNEV